MPEVKNTLDGINSDQTLQKKIHELEGTTIETIRNREKRKKCNEKSIIELSLHIEQKNT